MKIKKYVKLQNIITISLMGKNSKNFVLNDNLNSNFVIFYLFEYEKAYIRRESLFEKIKSININY